MDAGMQFLCSVCCWRQRLNPTLRLLCAIAFSWVRCAGGECRRCQARNQPGAIRRRSGLRGCSVRDHAHDGPDAGFRRAEAGTSMAWRGIVIRAFGGWMRRDRHNDARTRHCCLSWLAEPPQLRSKQAGPSGRVGTGTVNGTISKTQITLWRSASRQEAAIPDGPVSESRGLFMQPGTTGHLKGWGDLIMSPSSEADVARCRYLEHLYAERAFHLFPLR